MKIKKWAVMAFLLLLTAYSIIVYKINHTTVEKGDFVTHNGIVKEVERQVKNHETLQVSKDYQVVLSEDENYEKTLYKAYADNAVVMDLMKNDLMIGKVIFPPSTEREQTLHKHILILVTIAFLGLFLAGCFLYSYVYLRFIKPFQNLEQFATRVSAGDFEFSLHMTKKNYFGAFTESFDLMRDELLRARKSEYEANRSKKELVASLSHDIKTPVATIKANCELLEAIVEDEKILKKLGIIEKKADVISALMDNMFHATLEEIHMLKVKVKEEPSTKIKPMFEEINHYGLIEYENEFPSCLLYYDTLRLSQVIDNIIGNSYKYANTKILVSSKIEGEQYCIQIRDYGTGVPEEELPMIFEKFYRGSNAESSNGSGLGLYISKQFMTKMQGELTCFNDHGFVITLSLPII